MADVSGSPTALEEIRRGIFNVAVPHNEAPSTLRRRRVIVAIVLVLGAAALSLAFQKHPGDSAFFWWSMALAGVWALGRVRYPDRCISAVPAGAVAISAQWSAARSSGCCSAASSLLGGLVVQGDPGSRRPRSPALLHYTDQGSWRLTMAVALVAAVAEEMFYRGALYTALSRHHPLLISTIIYAIATLGSSRNPMLAFAAIILGTVCALERRATGGVLAPILTHFVWTLVVLLGLPPLFGL